jgi:hypothetical protein
MGLGTHPGENLAAKAIETSLRYHPKSRIAGVETSSEAGGYSTSLVSRGEVFGRGVTLGGAGDAAPTSLFLLPFPRARVDKSFLLGGYRCLATGVRRHSGWVLIWLVSFDRASIPWIVEFRAGERARIAAGGEHLARR